VRSRRSYLDYLRDILQASQDALGWAEAMDFETFRADRRTNLAVVRALETIGEAARNIPASYRRRYPQVPWRDMMDMRNKLIHEYFGIDQEVLWRPVRQDLPPLCDAIRQMVAEMESQPPA
jgi:uncharacterized protein with HEPN domain